MSVFEVVTYLVKEGKRKEFILLVKDFLKYKKANPKLFKGIKSWKLFEQELGGISGLYIEMWEFENLADMERIMARISGDEGMKKIHQRFHQLIEHTTFSASIWSKPV